MLNAQKEAYGDGLDHNLLHKYMWICKAHYYDFGYYNFPYTFGLLFSLGLYAKYQEMGSKFVEKYDNLLSVTGKLNVADTAKEMGIDVHSVDFWKSSLDVIKNDIDKFLAL
jgi:oligoendopeptidase F